jgi:hypothetical protein
MSQVGMSTTVQGEQKRVAALDEIRSIAVFSQAFWGQKCIDYLALASSAICDVVRDE